MTDVKIPSGNNRQCDLLAYDVVTREQYHAESSVTHRENWCPDIKQLSDIFDRKFRGVPPKREGSKTDFAKGKNYYENILQAYRNVGLDPSKIQRVFITWEKPDESDLVKFLTEYEQENGIHIEVWSFRDQILPELTKKVSTSNYDDEVLRTLSLLRQQELQTHRSE